MAKKFRLVVTPTYSSGISSSLNSADIKRGGEKVIKDIEAKNIDAAIELGVGLFENTRNVYGQDICCLKITAAETYDLNVGDGETNVTKAPVLVKHTYGDSCCSA